MIETIASCFKIVVGYVFSIVTFSPATSQLLREIYSFNVVLDVDECASNSHSCDVNAVCGNSHGSHTCTCKAGYSGDGRTCSGTFVQKFWHASVVSLTESSN